MIKKPSYSSENLAEVAVQGIQEVKGHEITSVDLRNIPNAVCDFFIICHGTSDTQVEAISKSVEKFIHREMDENPIHKEGTNNAEWILLDYFDVVVHIFKEQAREFYNLEKLWADADVKEIDYQL